MGRFMFDSKLFDDWLNARVEKILPRMDEGNLSNEDMIALLLKAQTNHFHHMDEEFREEFKAIRADGLYMDGYFKDEFKAVRNEMSNGFKAIRIDMDKMDEHFKEEFKAVRSEMMSKSEAEAQFKMIQLQFKYMMWGIGIIITIASSIFIKMFVH